MSLSVIILTKNEEQWVEGAIKSALFADEIIIIDTGSTDKTLEIARKYTSSIYFSKSKSFAAWRNLGIKKAKREWIFYLDADERITKLLQKELLSIIKSRNNKFVSYAVPRKNFYFGFPFNYCNSYPDYQHRFFRRNSILRWEGVLHERPILADSGGSCGYLKNPFWHFTHRDIESMVDKTNRRSIIEAKELLASKHPPMVWWRFFSVVIRSFLKQFITFKCWKDGNKGIVEGFFQIFSNFITYAKLWELQQNGNSMERYKKLGYKKRGKNS